MRRARIRAPPSAHPLPYPACSLLKVQERRRGAVLAGTEANLQEPSATFLFVDGIVQADKHSDKLAINHGQTSFRVLVPGSDPRGLQVDVGQGSDPLWSSLQGAGRIRPYQMAGALLGSRRVDAKRGNRA